MKIPAEYDFVGEAFIVREDELDNGNIPVKFVTPSNNLAILESVTRDAIDNLYCFYKVVANK